VLAIVFVVDAIRTVDIKTDVAISTPG